MVYYAARLSSPVLHPHSYQAWEAGLNVLEGGIRSRKSATKPRGAKLN